jgi:hypothetical protein
MTNNSPENRDTSGRFLPGVSGNPGGRPVGLSGMIRDATNEGAELIEFVLGLFRGEHGSDIRMRADAASWLADRGFGKNTQSPADSDGCPRCAAFDIEMVTAKEQLSEKLASIRERMFPGLPADQCACLPCYEAYNDALLKIHSDDSD